MDTVEQVNELVEARLAQEIENLQPGGGSHFEIAKRRDETLTLEAFNARQVELANERATAARNAYVGRPGEVAFAERTLIELGFSLDSVDLGNVRYRHAARTEHTGNMVITLFYANNRHYTNVRGANFKVSTDKNRNRTYAIKSGFKKQIEKRLADRAGVESFYAGLKDARIQEQIDVKAVFAQATHGTNLPVKLNSTLEQDRHWFSLDLAGKNVGMWLGNESSQAPGKLLVKVRFGAGGAGRDSDFIKVMTLEDFLASELVQMIYLDGALD